MGTTLSTFAPRSTRSPKDQTGKSNVSLGAERRFERTSVTSKPFALETREVFDSMVKIFKFQPNNAKNQHEHLLSLYLSHLSCWGFDRESDAIRRLMASLLRTYFVWASDMKFDVYDNETSATRETLTLVLGNQTKSKHGKKENSYEDDAINEDVFSTATITADRRRKLLEMMCLYLLVWGEAGNARFCPRIIFFIFHAAWHHWENYNFADDDEENAFPENDYLDVIVTPLYSFFFDQMYVGLGGNTPKSRPKGRIGLSFETTKHYDDMDEMLLSRDLLKALGLQMDLCAETVCENMVPMHNIYLSRPPRPRPCE